MWVTGLSVMSLNGELRLNLKSDSVTVSLHVPLGFALLSTYRHLAFEKLHEACALHIMPRKLLLELGVAGS